MHNGLQKIMKQTAVITLVMLVSNIASPAGVAMAAWWGQQQQSNTSWWNNPLESGNTTWWDNPLANEWNDQNQYVGSQSNTVYETASNSSPTDFERDCDVQGEIITVDQFRDAYNEGRISAQITTNIQTNRVTAWLDNQTGCSVPLSLSVYKMFDQVLSHQEYFAGTDTITVPPFTSHTFESNLPTCMAQIDFWYGTAPRTLLDSNPYWMPGYIPGVFAYKFTRNEGSGYADARGDFCSRTPTQTTLKVEKSGPATIEAGSEVTYTLKVTNIGSVAAENFVLFDNVEAPLTFVRSNPNTCTLTSSAFPRGTVRCAYNSPVPAGQSVTYQLTFRVDASAACNSVINNKADITSSNAPNAWSNMTQTRVECAPPPEEFCRLEISKSVDKAEAIPGDILTYTINIRNTGTAYCTGGGVKMEDTLPAGITYQSQTRSSGISAGYNGHPAYDSSNRTLFWNAHEMAPGSSGWVRVKATVNSNISCGATDIYNNARITSAEYDDFSEWVTSNTVKTTATKDCEPPAQNGCIAIIKETYDTAGNPLNPVAQFTFRLDGDRTVQNDANGRARFDNVTPGTHTVTEIVPASWSLVSVTPANGTIQVPAGNQCAAVVFKNRQILLEPTLVVTPPSATVEVGSSQQYTAMYDPDGPSGPQGEVDVTTSAFWNTAHTALATPNGNGRFTGVSPGTAIVSASYNGIPATARLIVTRTGGSAPSVETRSATSVTVQGATLNGRVNPNDSATSCRFDYGTTLQLTTQTAMQQVGSGNATVSHEASIAGLQANTVYYFRIVCQNEFGVSAGQILSFTTEMGFEPTLVVTPPSATVEVGSSQQYTAMYDPDGPSGPQNATDISTNAAWSSQQAAVASHQGNGVFRGNAIGMANLQAAYNSLVASARLNVVHGNGDAPSAQTQPATNVSQNSATLRGVGNPNGDSTSCRFQYGTTMQLSNQTPSTSIGAGNSEQNASALVTNLQANTTYYFRVTCQNSFGTANGQILSFTTDMQTEPTLVVSPSSRDINVGDTGAFTAMYDPDGTAGPAPEQNVTANATWTSSNLGIATHEGNGVFSGVADGTVTITAFYQGLSGTATLRVRFLNQNPPIAQTTPATSVTEESAVINGLVNPNGSVTVYHFEYGTTTALGNATVAQQLSAGTSNQNVSVSLQSLQPNTTYYFRVTAANQHGTSHGSILSFTTPGTTSGNAPLAQTQPATPIAQTSATLRGVGNPNGSASSCRFEYGTSLSLGTATAIQSIGSGTANQNVTASLTNLQPNTTYYFRVACQNTFGTANGAILSFTTEVDNQGVPPVATTQAATNVTQNSAALNGSVNANGFATTYRFEYGLSTSLGTATAVQSIGSGTANQNVTASLTNLQPNTTYYFRVTATNQHGTSQGAILSFTTGAVTQGSAPLAQTNPASSVSQNSATLNGVVNPNGYSTNYRFEYGTSPSLGTATNVQSAGAGSFNQNVAVSLTNLQANTTYYFRVTADNQHGSANGAILSFTTAFVNQGSAPVAVTNSATNVTQQSGINLAFAQVQATLNGQVNPNGVQTSYWFEYGTTQSLGQTTSFQSAGAANSSFTVSQLVSGLNPNTTYYFRIVAQNQYGTSYGQILTFTTQNTNFGSIPSVQTNPATNVAQNSALLNGQVNPNGSETIVFFEYGVNPGLLTQVTNSNYYGAGTASFNVSQITNNLAIATTYYFRAVARNNYGTAYGQVLSFTTPGVQTFQNLPIVYTRPATLIYQNSALLNGQVNPNGGLTSAWFEYGPTPALGIRTSYQQPMGAGNALLNYSFAVSGLLPNTNYYFRAVGQNPTGIAYGEILSFRTIGIATPPPPILPPPVTPTPTPNPPVTVVQTGTLPSCGCEIKQPIVVQLSSAEISGAIAEFAGMSCMAVVPTVDITKLLPGQEFTYTVTYRNNCGFAPNNMTLKLILPAEVDFISSNYPFISREANTVTYSLGSVPENTQSAIAIKATVRGSVPEGSNLIFSAIMSFDDKNGKMQTVSSYINEIVGDGGGDFAALFANFGDWMKWVLVLLILLAILSLLYWAFGRRASAPARTVMAAPAVVAAAPAPAPAPPASRSTGPTTFRNLRIE